MEILAVVRASADGLLRRPAAWRVLDSAIAIQMLVVAFLLVLPR